MHLTTSPILRSVRQVGSIQPKSSFIKRYLLRGRSSLARPLTSVPLSPRRSPHALAACTRPPHALAARARLCSYRSQSAGDGSPQCSGPAYVVPSCPPTLHAHAAAPIHHPQCPRLDPLRLHPPHHTSRRLTRPPRSLHPRPSRVRDSPQAHGPLATALLPSHRYVRLLKRGDSSPLTWLALLSTLRVAACRRPTSPPAAAAHRTTLA